MVAAPVRTHTFAFCVPSSPWWREEKTQLSGTTLHTLLIFPCSANRTDKEKPRIFWKEERNPSDAPSFLGPTALPPLSPSATAKVACCWGKERGESGSGERRGKEERNSLGWRPEGRQGPHRPVEERGRTRREGRRVSPPRTRTQDTCLLLSRSAPTLTAPVSTKANLRISTQAIQIIAQAHCCRFPTRLTHRRHSRCYPTDKLKSARALRPRVK